MYIDKVNISETYEIVNGQRVLRWQKIDASAALQDHESAMKSAQFVQDFIAEWNKKQIEKYETTVQPTQEEKVITQQKEKPQSTKDKILDGIATSKELTVLKSYELLAKNYPDVKEAYNQKLKELTQ